MAGTLRPSPGPYDITLAWDRKLTTKCLSTWPRPKIWTERVTRSWSLHQKPINYVTETTSLGAESACVFLLLYSAPLLNICPALSNPVILKYTRTPTSLSPSTYCTYTTNPSSCASVVDPRLPLMLPSPKLPKIQWRDIGNAANAKLPTAQGNLYSTAAPVVT